MCLLGRHVTHTRHQFRFQTAEQPLHRRVVPEVAATTYALRDPVASQARPELPACILPTLIRVEHQTLRTTALLISHAQRLHDQISVRVGLDSKASCYSNTGERRSKQQFANSPDLGKALLDAIMDAFEAHQTMSTQALGSERVRDGLKDILLGPAQLYEALRARSEGRGAVT